MELKNNDVIEMNGTTYIIVETMETESKDNYVIALNIKNMVSEIFKEEKLEDKYFLKKVANDYLETKLRSVFNEQIKSRLLRDHNINYIVDDEENV